jgi:hypothetical protein
VSIINVHSSYSSVSVISPKDSGYEFIYQGISEKWASKLGSIINVIITHEEFSNISNKSRSEVIVQVLGNVLEQVKANGEIAHWEIFADWEREDFCYIILNYRDCTKRYIIEFEKSMFLSN